MYMSYNVIFLIYAFVNNHYKLRTCDAEPSVDFSLVPANALCTCRLPLHE